MPPRTRSRLTISKLAFGLLQFVLHDGIRELQRRAWCSSCSKAFWKSGRVEAVQAGQVHLLLHVQPRDGR